MTLKRDPSQALQVGFVALLLISTVQVGYWIYDHVENERAVERHFAELYQHDADAATAFYSGAAPREIADLLPHVALTPPRATVRPEALATLRDVRASRINRFVWEGGFFLAVLLGGIAVLTRTIRHDAELRRRQQNFLAAVSHEFKSPLASIQLASETLVLRSHENDTQRLGRRILEDCERLLRMIDNLLDTTRLEEGRQRLAPAVVSVRDAAAAGVAEIAERARLSSIDVTRRRARGSEALGGPRRARDGAAQFARQCGQGVRRGQRAFRDDPGAARGARRRARRERRRYRLPARGRRDDFREVL